MHLIIEKKARYTITALSVLLVILVFAQMVLSSPAFYNTLYQVVKNENSMESVDRDNNGYIDEAEVAYQLIDNNVINLPFICAKGQLLKGYDLEGVPLCVDYSFGCTGTEGNRVCKLTE